MVNYLTVIRSEGSALLKAALPRLDMTVPAYGDEWRVRDLVVHTGTVHRWVTGMVHALATHRHPKVATADVSDDALGTWFEAGIQTLVAALEMHHLLTPVWSLDPDEQTVGFWIRRMAYETSLHRWDAQSTHRPPDGFGTAVAAGALAQSLQIHFVQRIQPESLEARFATVRLEPHDAETCWIVSLEPERLMITPTVEQVAADACVSGSSSDLWLYLMRRPTAGRLGREGDSTTVRYFEQLIASIPEAERPLESEKPTLGRVSGA